VPIVCLSITHHTAPVALRERLALSGPALDASLARAGGEREPGGRLLPVSELVILSTCNRLELYAAAELSSADGMAPWPLLVDFLAETLSLDPAAFATHIVHYVESSAAEHLCRVAAGLDSMVLGESEILGQVAEANEAAQRWRSTGPALSGLFRIAVQAGKRVRGETGIGRNPGSVSSVAVALAEQAAGGLRDRRVALIGAGRMARKAATALLANGVQEIMVVSRSLDSAAAVAAEWRGEAATLEELPQVLARADIVISSTSSPEPIVAAPLVRRAMAGRERPLVFIDIAVPRDIHPAVREIPGVQLFDLDGLQARLDRSLAERRKEIPRAEAIVAEAMARFAEWRVESDVFPLLSELRQQADRVRAQELDRMLRQLPAADAELRRRLEQFSHALVNKLLHQPTQRLRAEAGNGHTVEYAQVARELFGLSLPPPPTLALRNEAPPCRSHRL
jgi:glutamyl-tRNA reductase